jgi:hypothetical protein
MPSYKTVFGNYLKHEDLQGRAVRLTVEEARIEEIKGDKGDEKKLVVRFMGKDKGLVLNRTNADTLADLAGTEDYEQWEGVQLVLYPDKTKFGGKTVDCIRMRGPQEKAAPAPPPPAHEVPEDEIGF